MLQKPPKIIKRHFPSLFPAFLKHPKPHYSNLGHRRYFSRILLLPIPLENLIQTITLWNLMRSWPGTSRAYFRTNPCPQLLCSISPSTPQFFQHPYQLIFHNRGIPQFQTILTGNLKVTCPKPCHIQLLQTCRLRSLSQTHPLVPVSLQFMSPQYLHSHPQGCHS